MADTPDVVIDRLLAGEMSAEEERRLAQSALDDPDLFDSVTAAAVVQSVLLERERPGTRAEALPPAPVSAARRPWALAGSALAAAAMVVMALVYFRAPHPAPSAPAPAALVESPVAIAPVLLTARATPAAADTFRSDQISIRLPKPDGTIVTVRDGVADVDVGSLDGISEGLQVRVSGAAGSERGRLTITTVFRERARGRVAAGGGVRAGDRIDLSAGVYVGALLEQAAARQHAQDIAAVQQLLELAVPAADSREVPANLRRQAREQLGVLKHRANALGDAERLLTLATGDFETPPAAPSSERADVLNELGIVQIEQGARAAADRTLLLAESYAAGVARMRILNNRGAIAALNGDRPAARAFYESAQALAGDSAELTADRAAIQKNLNTLESRP